MPGLIYAAALRHIGNVVDPMHQTVAISVWLFWQDAAGLVGSNLIDYFRHLACGGGDYEYVCLKHN